MITMDDILAASVTEVTPGFGAAHKVKKGTGTRKKIDVGDL